ncbi:MAG: E3 binding domain-containing protein, partial [Acidobacteria bacterium]|nr:E3 binding domain-containing protein [Acidobacteriota bacterium]MBA3887933.1 E3 binding domain-containing protein [Acidobacteriota bacterium]
MPNEFTIPELGENITAGDVVRIMVTAGDTIEKDQPILELETDKATIEVPSDVSGTVKDIKVKQGDKVKVGQVVLTLDDRADGGKATKPAKDNEKKPGKDAPKGQPEGAPEEGGMSQAAPGKPGKTEAGEKGGAGKGAAERDQGTTTSEPDETLEDHGAGDGDAGGADEAPQEKKKRGEVVDIQRGARASAPPATSAAEPEGHLPPAAPSVRRMARELGVDIARVTGTGVDGRISTEDVQEYVKGALSGRGGG